MEIVFLSGFTLFVLCVWYFAVLDIHAEKFYIFFKSHSMVWFSYEEIKTMTGVHDRFAFLSTVRVLVNRKELELQIDNSFAENFPEFDVAHLEQAEISYWNIEHFQYRLLKKGNPWVGRKRNWNKFWDWIPKPKPQMARVSHF